MRRLPIFALTMALTASACAYREQKPTTSASAAHSGFGNLRDIDQTGSYVDLKTTDVDAGAGLPPVKEFNVIVDQMPPVSIDGGVTVGSVGQGTAAAIGAPWPVQISNGTAALIGQKTMATSFPVTLASDQSAIAVTPSLPSGAATESTLSTLSSHVPAPGQTTMALSVPVTIASNQSALSTSDSTAQSTLSTISSHIPANGQTTMSASVPVAIASNQSALNVAAASVANTTYWQNITSASTQSSTGIDTSGYRYACFQITEANTSTPVGTFGIEQSIDNSSFQAIYLDANRPQGANFTNASAFPGGATIAVSSPGGTVGIFVCVEKMMRYLRITYTRGSGGATSTINAQSWLSN